MEEIATWRERFPGDWVRQFSEINSGFWWQYTQEQIGPFYTVGGIIFYTDVTHVLKHMSCYPIYSTFLSMSLNMCFTLCRCVLIFQHLLTVSLCNYLNRRRHTNQGWVLVGFFPQLDALKGQYVGVNKMSRRKIRLWHACVSILTDSIRAGFATGVPVKCADGMVRVVKPVVAMWLNDRMEGETICAMVGVSFLFCNV